MNKIGLLSILLLGMACQKSISTSSSETELEAKVSRTLATLSLKEKVGQMTQLNLDMISVGEVYNLKEPNELDSVKLRKALVEYGVGSILNVGGHAYSKEYWNQIVSEIQRIALTETKAKIPVLYGIDAIHGANYLLNGTLFPQPLAQAATFNTELVEQGASITAYETRACGIPWNFSPVLDVARQPLWSRVFETYGEDVYMCKTMGLAAIKGYQGENAGDPEKVSACLKHFLGYSMPYTGKDRTAVYMDERMMREYFLPSFKAAIDAGALSIMINSGEINGLPVHANPDILTKLLREELGFDGVVVTDWEDIMKLEHPHRVATNLKEAVKIAINAGVDMSMVPNDYQFSDLLVELVEEGEVPMSRIDEAVSRVLRMKCRLNLFEEPYSPATHSYPLLASDSFVQASYNVAAESITLLKNEKNILPLKLDNKVMITGPMANALTLVNGAWTRTWQGTEPKWNDETKLTIVEAIKTINPNVLYAEGCGINAPTDMENAMSIALNADIIVACMGELPSTEKVGDIHSLDLEQAQIDYVERLAKTGKKIVLVLVENRSRIVREIEPLCAAIVMAYQPSENGTRALADILYGKINPSGKLPMTYPRYTNDLLTYDHKYTDRLDPTFGYNAFNPQWEFGHGLSYSNFTYSNLVLATKELGETDTINVSFTVTNNGSLDGKESALVYVADMVASVTPSVKRLRAFEKKFIAAGTSVDYTLNIPVKDLAFVNKDMVWQVEPGKFVLSVAGLSEIVVVK
jgi:beta-glucosidase